MRSALLSVFFCLTIHKYRCISSAKGEFLPTPIPLTEWKPIEPYERRIDESPQTTVPATEATPPAPPVHWDRELRTQIYIWLVRDKYNELDSLEKFKPHDKKTNDLRNYMNSLWEKIKNAPFDTYESEKSADFGDDTLMYKGRLMEENGHLHFIEDDINKVYCNELHCMDGVKALWFVRQRAPNAGYEYEVKEMAMQRPSRQIWLHKNIFPVQRNRGRSFKYYNTERLFSSLFMNDDYDHQRKYPHPTPPSYTPYSKVGYVGAPSDTHQYRKVPPPYAYKPYNPVKYTKHPIHYQPPPQHHYLDIDGIGVVSSPYVPQPPDVSYKVPMKPGKPMRAPFLPTPVSRPQINKNTTDTKSVIQKTNTTNFTTRAPEIITKHIPTSIKIHYFTEHVRPPIYNTPPGVFVTMDKKPFKPMPPLKIYSPSKTTKPSKPLDFRPSPQVLDIQFSEPDPLFANAFRPILVNYSTTEESTVAESSKTEEDILMKYNLTEGIASNNQQKKRQKNPVTSTTTSTTESEEDDYDDSLAWGNLLAAFSKTTPMESHEEKFEPLIITTESTSPSSTTASSTTETQIEEKSTSTTTATTTTKQRRTRPTSIFRNNKVRKHKRVTTTTKAPEKIKSPIKDLTPQASSAIRTTARWSPSTTSNSAQIVTTESTTNLNSELQINSTIVKQKSSNIKSSTSKNRFRESALMHKGTSVKHHKWSSGNKNFSKSFMQLSGQYPPRRTSSNFHGYVNLTKPKNSNEENEDYSEDFVSATTTQLIKTVRNLTKEKSEDTEVASSLTKQIKDDEGNKNEKLREEQLNQTSEKDYSDEEIIEDEINKQYLDDFISIANSTKINEITDFEDSIITKQHNIMEATTVYPKNKTKCRQKKTNIATEMNPVKVNEQITTPLITTTIENTADILDQLLSDIEYVDLEKGDSDLNKTYTAEESDNKYEGTKHKDHVKIEDYPDLFDDFEDDESIQSDKTLYKDNDDEIDKENMDIISSEETKHNEGNFEDFKEHPYNIFELMAME